MSSTVVLVVFGCASQPSPPVSVQSSSAPNALPAPPAAPLAASPPQAEAKPPDSSPTGSFSPAISEPATSEPPPEVPERRETPMETQQCSARGGTIQPICRLGKVACVVRYPDGGKRCSDKADCTGQCLYEGPTPAPSNASGSCQPTSDPCGCKAPIHHGRVQPTICLD